MGAQLEHTGMSQKRAQGVCSNIWASLELGARSLVHNGGRGGAGGGQRASEGGQISLWCRLPPHGHPPATYALQVRTHARTCRRGHTHTVTTRGNARVRATKQKKTFFFFCSESFSPLLGLARITHAHKHISTHVHTTHIQYTMICVCRPRGLSCTLVAVLDARIDHPVKVGGPLFESR